MFPKSKPVRDKAWRQRVAEMPCAGCGLEGSSQAAHARGLGMGIKASDHLCIPLCCARPGVEGCHAAYDRCRAFPGHTRDETKEIVADALCVLAAFREELLAEQSERKDA